MEDVSKMANQSMAALNSTNITMNANTDKALTNLKTCFKAEPKEITPEVSQMLVGLSSNLNDQIMSGKVEVSPAIFKVFNLGMMAIL